MEESKSTDMVRPSEFLINPLVAAVWIRRMCSESTKCENYAHFTDLIQQRKLAKVLEEGKRMLTGAGGSIAYVLGRIVLNVTEALPDVEEVSVADLGDYARNAKDFTRCIQAADNLVLPKHVPAYFAADLASGDAGSLPQSKAIFQDVPYWEEYDLSHFDFYVNFDPVLTYYMPLYTKNQSPDRTFFFTLLNTFYNAPFTAYRELVRARHRQIDPAKRRKIRIKTSSRIGMKNTPFVPTGAKSHNGLPAISTVHRAKTIKKPSSSKVLKRTSKEFVSDHDSLYATKRMKLLSASAGSQPTVIDMLDSAAKRLRDKAADKTQKLDASGTATPMEGLASSPHS